MKNWCLFLLLITSTLHGQVDSLATLKLKEVVVNSLKQSTVIAKFPGAISIQNISTDFDGPKQSLQDYLTNLPGIISFNAHNYAQDLRLSVRGFGSRSAFGIRGIQLIVDGIPETTPDGQGQLDNLPLGILSKIELIRGPSALRYGNASGGVLYLETQDSENPVPHRIEMGGGQFGYRLLEYTGGVREGKTSVLFHLNHREGKGYRQHSRYKTHLFNTKLKHTISAKSELSAQLNLMHSPYADDAGGQTLEEFTQNRRSARDRNVLFKSGETVSHVKAGVGYAYTSENIRLKSYGFYAYRLFNGRLPFENGGIVDLSRNYYGQGSDLTLKYNTGKLIMETLLGYSFLSQSDHRNRYVNANGRQGNLTLDQGENFQRFGSYFIQQLQYKRWTLNGGIRWDSNQLELMDYFLSNGDATDQRNLNAWSPKVGLSYRITSNLYGYANHAKSYETPTLSELSADPNGGGGFNDLLTEQIAINTEFGFKFTSNQTQGSITYFHINSQNDLVPYELASSPGRTFYRNTGTTQRKGIEVDFQHQFYSNTTVQMTFNSTHFTYTNFQRDSVSFKGKTLPGIPKVFGSVALRKEWNDRWKFSWNRVYRGELYANDTNTATVDGFWIDQIALTHTFAFLNTQSWATLGCSNLLNIHYSDNIRINAFGGRFYEAAPTRSAYFRLAFNF